MDDKLKECTRCGSVVSDADDFCRVCNEPQNELVSGETISFDETDAVMKEPLPPIMLPAVTEAEPTAAKPVAEPEPTAAKPVADPEPDPEPAAATSILDQGPAGDTPLKDKTYLEITEKKLRRREPEPEKNFIPPPIPPESPREKQARTPPVQVVSEIKNKPTEPKQTKQKPVESVPQKVDPKTIKRHKVKADQFDEMVNTCRGLQQSDYDLFGLFGRPEAGKSSFIYALKEHFKSRTDGFGGFTTEGAGWDELAGEMDEYWREGRTTATDNDHYYIYQAANHDAKRHIAIIDIAGEHFEGLKWSDEVLDFFGAYLGRCKGFFMLMELDESAHGHATDLGAKRKSRQMESIITFLSMAATVGEIRDAKDRDARLDAIDQARQGLGKSRVTAPVVLCLSKADRIAGMRFGDHGRIIPGDGTAMGDPWNVVEKLWPGHFRTLLKLAPHLKIEWVSCLGPGFEEKRRFSGSWGLQSVMKHVVLAPPPKWSLPAHVYRRFRKWIRV